MRLNTEASHPLSSPNSFPPSPPYRTFLLSSLPFSSLCILPSPLVHYDYLRRNGVINVIWFNGGGELLCGVGFSCLRRRLEWREGGWKVMRGEKPMSDTEEGETDAT